MSEKRQRNGNGSQWPPNWIGLFHALAGKPAEYLLLVVLLGGLAWFVDREARHREQVYAPLLAACLREFQK
jgi:hypothetical protein